MTETVFECRDVVAGYRADGAETAVLRDVTFTVAAGEVVVLVGASGSGKTTLLRLLNRFDEPLAGVVSFRGQPVTDYDPLELRRRIALLLQTPVMFEGTVRDNLLMRPKGVAVPGDADLARLLGDVGLEAHFLDENAERLSVGEKQRVAIARALVTEPEALLLDEPTSALDPKNASLVAETILRLRESLGLTIVVVTHTRELVEHLGGRRFLAADGRLEVDASDAVIERFLEG